MATVGFQQAPTPAAPMQTGSVVPAQQPAVAGPRPKKRVMKEEAAAQYIEMSVAFLRRARLERRGPRVTRLGRSVRYLVDDLDRWLEQERDKGDQQ